MTPEEYIAAMHDGLYLEKGTELTACMRPMAKEAQKITAEINGAYHTPEEVAQDEEGMQTMRNLARSMAWLLKCIAAGRAQGVSLPDAERTYRTNFIR